MSKKNLRIPDLMKKVENKEKLIMVTAYDYLTSVIADSCGVDMLLIGDSLGTVVLGYETTSPVTMEDIIHHTRPVVRGAKQAMVVADMPFGSYQISNKLAIENAIRIVQEGGASAVKLEGGLEILDTVKCITKAGVPVIAHIGLLPQIAPLWDGYHTRGRDEASAWALVDAAVALEEAGAFAIVLECVAREAAALITEKTDIPTIGIGSGPDCDGQVLVGQDLFGMNVGGTPYFVKKFGDVAGEISKAISAYAEEVKNGTYPGESQTITMQSGEARKLY